MITNAQLISLALCVSEALNKACYTYLFHQSLFQNMYSIVTFSAFS